MKWRWPAPPPLKINFIDEDGEVLQLQTEPGDGDYGIFDRYALEQRTPFLLSRVMCDFTYNGKLINSSIREMEVVAGDDIIVYATTKVPSRTVFHNWIVNNIPSFVNNQPHCFLNQVISIKGDQDLYVVKEYSEDSDSFILGIRRTDGFAHDFFGYLQGLVSKHQSQVEILATNQDQDKPNQILLRIIKIERQIYRFLNYIDDVKDQELCGEDEMKLFSHYTQKLGKALSSLAVKKRIHLTYKSIHRVNKPIKPVYEPGDLVYVLSQNEGKDVGPTWEKRTIKSSKEYEDIDGYGPRRTYTIRWVKSSSDVYYPIFENGKDLVVEDYQVMSIEDYEMPKHIKESEWKGVKHIVDEESTDQWAREVGWYTVNIDGMEGCFIHFSNALRAYDISQAFIKRGDLKVNDLNLPREWVQFFKTVAEKGDVDDVMKYLNVELDLIRVYERISDPNMKHLCRALIYCLMNANDLMLAKRWKVALGQFLDGNITSAKFAAYVLRQRGAGVGNCGRIREEGGLEYTLDNNETLAKEAFYIFAIVNQSITVDISLAQVFYSFIGAEGNIDAFLLKLPLLCEAHKAIISPDKDAMLTYILDNEPEDSDDLLFIRCKEGNILHREVAVYDEPFNDFLTKYATNRGTSIKSLRIKHNGKTLFLSSIRKKSIDKLNINDEDVLEITIMRSTATKTTTNEQSKQSPPKGKKKNKKHKKSKKKRPVQIAPPEDLKGEHSKLLGKIHEEAEPTFKEIRQRLNALNLERTKPKQRTSPPKAKPVEVVDNPLGVDQLLGGKAGKTQFIIQVGEVSNLYKTTKPTAGRGRRQDDIMIDLHGLTAEEAVYRLDKHLPKWIDTAIPLSSLEFMNCAR